MSILHLVRCERYEACKQEFSFGANTIASDFAPENWITLFEGNPRTHEGWNFCSKACLALWILEKWHLNVGVVAPLPEPQDKPACKARRFLLVDGETADISEGIKWSNGWVTYETEKTATFSSWEQFKEHNPGSGVQWIDQEVSK